MNALYQQIVTAAVGLGVLFAGVLVFREGDTHLGAALIAAGTGTLGVSVGRAAAPKPPEQKP